MEGQMSIFDYSFEDSTPKELSNYKIQNKVRLIELFAGVGSQAMAMKRLGVPFEHYRCVEFDKYPVASYNAIHGTDFPTITSEVVMICRIELARERISKQ